LTKGRGLRGTTPKVQGPRIRGQGSLGQRPRGQRPKATRGRGQRPGVGWQGSIGKYQGQGPRAWCQGSGIELLESGAYSTGIFLGPRTRGRGVGAEEQVPRGICRVAGARGQGPGCEGKGLRGRGRGEEVEGTSRRAEARG